jgi:hypothetical protein
MVEPIGFVVSIGRMLTGSPKGIVGVAALNATMMSSRGFILTVSFHPTSLESGGVICPSQPTRLMTCTLKRWKWMK